MSKEPAAISQDQEWNHLSFRLSDDFIKSYEDRKPPFGFDIGGGNTLGELTWLTKYSRTKDDGTKERWYEGCRRVVEGVYSILKDHCTANRTPWNAQKSQRAAEDMYDRLWSMKWTPPGRGLWMMGTKFVMDEGSAALQNCSFISTENLGPRNATLPFVRLMEMSMLGIGVGFDTRGADKLTVHRPSDEDVTTYVVPDSREGWCESLNLVLRSYLLPNQSKVQFDYSQIRPAGEPIKRFGGVAAGPAPLERLHREIRRIFDRAIGEPFSSTLIVDVGNMVGKCLPGDAWVLTSDGPRQIKDLIGVKVPLIIDGKAYEMESEGFFQTGEKPVLNIVTDQGWNVRLTADHQVRMDSGEWIEAGELSPGDEVRLHEHVDVSWQGNGSTDEGYVLGHLVGDGSIRTTNWGELAMLFTWDTDDGVEPVRKEISRIISLMPHRSDWKAWRYNGGAGRQICSSKAITKLASSYGIVKGNKKVTDAVESSSSDFYIGFLRGLFDADGSVNFESRTITLSQSDRSLLLRVQRMLGRLGILSTVSDEYRNNQCVLYIGGVDAVRFMDRVGFLNSNKTERYHRKPWIKGPYNRSPKAVIERIVPDGVEPVYDVTVSEVHAFDANGFYVHNCVVAGNVRRSAEIALGFADDQDFLELKDWNVNPERMGGDGWGHLSNNSIMVSTGDNLDPLVDKIAINGEPGILYMDLMRSHGRLIDPPNHKDSRAKGCNPCVTGDTWVQTVNGPRQVDDLIDVSVPLLVNGLPYEMESNGFFSTGKRPVLAITTTDGREVKVTAEHPMMTPDGWVEAGDLTIGDILVLHDHGTTRWDGPGSDAEGYLLGLLIGDGTFMGNRNRATLCSWGEGSGPAASRDEAERAFNSLNLSTRSDFKGWGGPHGNGWMRFAPKALTTLAAQYGVTADSKTITKAIEQGGSSLAIGVLRGLFDADGHVEGKTKDKGCSIRLSNTDRNLLTAVQRMLGRLGINSRVYGMREAGQRSLPGGEYECKKSWRLVIGGNHCARFMDAVGFSDIEKATKYHETMIGARHYEKSFTSEIASIDSLGTQPTWDVTVESVHAFDANGFYVSNCAEQTLENMECCTLVETYPTNCEDFEDFRRTLKAAYMYGKAVTLLPTHWPESNEVMKRNHRIGTSVTGLTMFAEEHGWTTLRQWLDDGYAEIQRRDRQYSEWLGVRESVKTTSVKPSGTVSLLAGVTPGVHWPVAGEQYFRRVRYSKIDPIIPVLEAAGYHVEASVADPDADVVVTFPTTGPKVRSEREVSVWEKVNLAGLLQKYWADNMVSATFTFAPHEEREVGSILRAMDGQLKSMSFLPMGEELSAGAYPQMPYQKVTDEEFSTLQSNVVRLDMDSLYSSNREAEGERFCSNDTCTI